MVVRLGITAVVIATFALVVGAALTGSAGDTVPFDARAFASAQAAGDGIVVAVHAPW